MSQPLGRAVGNALEVRESVEVLGGRGPDDVRALTLELAALMLALSGAESTRETAMGRARRALESGAAWEKFLAMVEAQGGDARSVQRPDGLPRAPVIVEVRSPRAGRLASVDTFGLGELVVAMGGGRLAKEDRIDPRVGMIVHRRLGDTVERGEALAELHLAAANETFLARAVACFGIEDREVALPELVVERVD
jgi:thymidine phosphorylase